MGDEQELGKISKKYCDFLFLRIIREMSLAMVKDFFDKNSWAQYSPFEQTNSS